MGASSFWCESTGTSAKETFTRLAEESRRESGHSYSGEIGMKQSFKMVTVPSGTDPFDFADKCLADENHWVEDKWGPAACVQLSEGRWLFFGWAAS